MSAGGSTMCSFPGGVDFIVPTPRGYPDSMEAGGLMYHDYSVSRPLNGTSTSCVMQGMTNNPTPGNPNAASSQGTPNNATMFGQNNFVTSYATHDLNTGAPVVVNIAGVNDGSQFGPGYVARYTRNGRAYTVGEGTNWKQSPYITGHGVGFIANQLTWGSQMSDIIGRCGCGN